MGLSDLRQLHFLQPLWLLLLPLLWLFAAGMLRRRTAGGAWAGVLSEEVLGALRLDRGAGGSSPWLLAALAWTLAVVALAGPAWRRVQSAGYHAPDDWVIVLDVSLSMAAADVAPDRISRARYAIDDLLGAAHDARVALIVFAGEPHTVVPLTSDVATIKGLLKPLGPALMPEAGDALAPALEQAGRLMYQSGSRGAQVLVLSDGVEDPAGALAAARRLREAGAVVHVVGVGTAAGAPLKDGRGGFVHDANGDSVLTRLPVDELQHLAAAGGGRYVGIDAVGQLIAALRAPHASPLAGGELDVRRQVPQWRNEGAWLLPPILLLASLFARRGWL